MIEIVKKGDNYLIRETRGICFKRRKYWDKHHRLGYWWSEPTDATHFLTFEEALKEVKRDAFHEKVMWP